MSRSAILKRLILPLALPALLSVGLSGCFTLRQGTFAPPTAADVGPVLDNYGEAIVPVHGLIVVQGDDLIYGVADHSRREGINGSAVHRTGTTITETLRQVLKGVAIVNQGYPGDTAAMGAQRWADAPVGNLVVLSYGYGDAAAKTPVADSDRALRGMVRRAHAQGAAVFLIPTPPMAATPPVVSKKPQPVSHLLTTADFEPYRAAMRQIGQDESVEVFEPQAELTRVKATPTKTVAQSSEIYQAIAGGLVPYIRIVPAKRP
ncbi:MAG: SGNH/GDSL hydrolase family protein [Caulobacteraceae bacterium]